MNTVTAVVIKRQADMADYGQVAMCYSSTKQSLGSLDLLMNYDLVVSDKKQGTRL